MKKKKVHYASHSSYDDDLSKKSSNFVMDKNNIVNGNQDYSKGNSKGKKPGGVKYRGLLNIGFAVEAVARELVGKSYSPLTPFIKSWKELIGGKYHKYCAVQKIRFPKGKRAGATLYIVAYNSAAASYIDANELYIIEKIATHFGYKAVARLVIRQQPKIIDSEDASDIIGRSNSDNDLPRKITDSEAGKLQKFVNNITNSSLRDSLQALGEAMIARNKTGK